jgi:hypothetical protein
MTQPISGVKKKLAIKKAAAWGTAVAVGAGDGIMYLSGTMRKEATSEVDASRGLYQSMDGSLGPIKCDASYNSHLRYNGQQQLYALFMGIAGAPAQQGATAAYKSILKWSKDTYGIFATLVELIGAYTAECPTAQLVGITISGAVGPTPLQITMEWVGINKVPDSATNTTVTFLNVTIPETENPVLFSQCVFRMNDRSDVALAVGHKIYPSKFTLSLKRPMAGEYTGEFRTATAKPQELIDQPTNAGAPDLKLTLEFAKHIDATYLNVLGTDTRKKLDITATGAEIANPYNYQHLWQFPHLQLINDNPTDDNGRIKEPLEFMIHGTSTAPTGMDGIIDPLWWTIIDKRTTDPLA